MVRHFLGPDPIVEPRAFRVTEGDGEDTFVGAVNSVPSTVGGGAVHADGKVPRFREEDFALLSARGPMPDAVVADWPLDYAELEPFYAEAERLIGVAGDADANPFAAWRSGPYPMPPGAPMYVATLTAAAAEKLGYHPYAAPTAANSVPYDGRPACNNCGFCAFFGCPIHAKGDPVALLIRALRTGRARLAAETFAGRIIVRDGRAAGVELVADGRSSMVSAKAVVVAGGAMESPRLLLLSGLTHPLVGRFAMVHFQTYVVGHLPMRLHGHRGRSVTHVHDDHLVPDAESARAAVEAQLPWLKGGMVEHGSGGQPVLEAKLYPWGAAHKAAMRDSPMREHLAAFCMQGEDVPQATNRVDLHPTLRDVRGFPALRLTYRPHRHELAASAHYGARLAEILTAAGAQWTATATSPMPDAPYGDQISPVPWSQHMMGTLRMGRDPADAVCDPWGRLFDLPNVLVADSSVFPTASGYGPTLTLVALALRNAAALAAEI